MPNTSDVGVDVAAGPALAPGYARRVRSLIATSGRAPVLLDHQIMGKPGPANVTLYYGCGSTGSCSMTRIEVAALEGMAVLTGDTGVWLRGCFAVTLDGNGYGVEHLDIELRKVGDGCPT